MAEHRADLAASFQAAVVGQLISKLKRALKRGDWEAVALGGGVAANGPLREAVARLCEERGVRLKLVPLKLCTDNAAMIGSAARFAPRIAYPDYLGYDAFATPRPSRRMTDVVVYSRPGCHLCEEAIAEIVALHEEGYRFGLHEIDIESDELLLRRHLERIPVVEVDGVGRLGARFGRSRPARQARYCGGMVEVIEEFDAPGGFPVEGDRLSLGVAARLSRYLQVLTQARKMGRDTISSQELSEYTHINPTQIRRDLSGFGKFGKRGVGYNVESLVSEIRKILRTSGQHNIALFGAGNLGQAIASSAIFADHGFQVVAVFDADPTVVGTEIGELRVRDLGDLQAVVADEEIVVGVLAVPAGAAQEVADRLVKAGVKIIFNYSEQLLQVPPEVTVHTSSPAVDLLYALYFYLA